MTEARLPFVWELNNQGVVSHAIGTMHALPNGCYFNTEPYLQGKSHLLLECDVKKKPTLLDKMIEQSRGMPKGDLLTEEEQQTFSRMTGTPQVLVGIMPLFAIKDRFFEHYGGLSNYGLDEQILTAAANLGFTPVGLETEEEVAVRFVERMMKPDLNELRRFMAMEKADPGSVKIYSRSFMDAYLNGDSQLLEQRFLEDKSLDMVTTSERNKRMVERSIPYLVKPSLIAVGVGHFILEQSSMRALYKEQGIVVRRI